MGTSPPPHCARAILPAMLPIQALAKPIRHHAGPRENENLGTHCRSSWARLRAANTSVFVPQSDRPLPRAHALQSIHPARLSKLSKVDWSVLSKLVIGWAVLPCATTIGLAGGSDQARAARRGEPADIVPPQTLRLG